MRTSIRMIGAVAVIAPLTMVLAACSSGGTTPASSSAAPTSASASPSSSVPAIAGTEFCTDLMSINTLSTPTSKDDPVLTEVLARLNKAKAVAPEAVQAMLPPVFAMINGMIDGTIPFPPSMDNPIVSDASGVVSMLMGACGGSTN